MKISTILDHIDNGHLALPEFQRGYVWNREQVRGLFSSLYDRHPVGSLLVWATEAATASKRGEGELARGVVKLLLDGQQRITSLYGVVRGKPPAFFEGNSAAFTNLRFHLEDEIFEFYQPITMRDNPLWIDVSELFRDGIDKVIAGFEGQSGIVKYVSRLTRLVNITDIDLHIEEITGEDKSIDVVVDIFNRVNSGGTKLSKGDLALAKIVVDWPDGRQVMREQLKRWEDAGFTFSMDWLLRSINTVITGKARFLHLHDVSAEELQDGFHRATTQINRVLNLISGRLGLDHAQVLFGRFAIPVMVHYLDRRSQHIHAMDYRERDKLLFWYAQAAMWGRYSSSTESVMDQDLTAIAEGGLDQLLHNLRLWHGSFRASTGNFIGWSRGARFYPVLYMLTRMGEASDLGSGLPLKANLLGRMNSLEVHHIFPRSLLYRAGHRKSEVNALANYCFLTRDTNLSISNRPPEVYFREVEENQPGALASQWIPTDPELWRLDNYPAFLEARKDLLAAELNRRMEELLHGETHWLDGPAAVAPISATKPIISEAEADVDEDDLAALNSWIKSQGLAAGELDAEVSDQSTGDQLAVLDLAWPNGLQEELTEPVALIIDPNDETLAYANQAGYRCFRDIDSLKIYVERQLSGEEYWTSS